MSTNPDEIVELIKAGQNALAKMKLARANEHSTGRMPTGISHRDCERLEVAIRRAEEWMELHRRGW